METEKRQIDANALERRIVEMASEPNYQHIGEDWKNGLCMAMVAVNEMPTVDAVEVPCKIGDFVWAIRNYKGQKHPQRGVVSDMYFTNDMRLQIVVKHIARGEWGKTVFATDKEAYEAIGERKNNG